MKLSKDQVKHVADLANIKLSEKEEKDFQGELSSILSYVEKLGEANVDQVEPLVHAAGFKNVERDDQTEPSLSVIEALKNAKETHNDLVKIDAIFEEN